MRLHIRWADVYSGFSQHIVIDEGQATTVIATKTMPKVGGIGPAGGMIFYDKGSVSDGWRFLEAAPSDQSGVVRWYNG